MKLVIWDLGDTLLVPPPGGQDVRPLDEYPQVVARPGAAEVLLAVRALGLDQAVLSNTASSDSACVRRLLSRLEIVHHFAHIHATQSELTHDKPEKPDPAAFHIVLDALCVAPADAVMVGNSWDNDILGANRSGMHAIWLTNPDVASRRDRASALQAPPWVIPVYDLGEVPAALRLLQARRP